MVSVRRRRARFGSPVRSLSLVGHLRNGCPSSLTVRLPSRGAVLLLGIFMRAVVEQLGIDFHEEFHGIVNHAVDGSVHRG